jgi:hypothetical protein
MFARLLPTAFIFAGISFRENLWKIIDEVRCEFLRFHLNKFRQKNTVHLIFPATSGKTGIGRELAPAFKNHRF